MSIPESSSEKEETDSVLKDPLSLEDQEPPHSPETEAAAKTLNEIQLFALSDNNSIEIDHQLIDSEHDETDSSSITNISASIRNEKKQCDENDLSEYDPINENSVINKSSTNDTDSDSNVPPAKSLESHTETANKSRELKSLLALAKEAKLETNLSRKRISLEHRRKSRSGSRGKHNAKYPVTAESELEMEHQSNDGIDRSKMDDASATSSNSVSLKSLKRKKSNMSDDSNNDENIKRSRKLLLTGDITVFKDNKDIFCWRCHKENVNISCETCPRSYHQKCLKQTITDLEHWPCPECVAILKAESTQTRSTAMRGMTLEQLCNLLKFAVSRMLQCQGSEPFIHAVNDNEFPDYKKYIIQPMDLTLLEKNIKENLYGSTQAFEADAKWMLHNSIIFNSYMEKNSMAGHNHRSKKFQSKLTTVAKNIIKVCKQEMAEIENCPNCYLNANTKKYTWFVQVCPKPHLLVWAKLRGFPYWPAKVMICKDGMVDVRFFGAHDRAWVPERDCFLYSVKDPNSFRSKRTDIEQCIGELNTHVRNLTIAYEEFNFAPFKTPLDPYNEEKQLQLMLPKYKSKSESDEKEESETIPPPQQEPSNETMPYSKKKIKTKRDSSMIKRPSSRSNDDDQSIEGYGTDDESYTQINTEIRKCMMKDVRMNEVNDGDEDDTQVPSDIEPDKSGIIEILTKDDNVHKQLDSNRSINETISPLSLFSPEDESNSNPISDKINKVDIAEDMEISLGNDDKGNISYSENISSSNSDSSVEFNRDLKMKPVQIDINNKEIIISQTSKVKMSDKLIQRLSDKDNSSLNAGEKDDEKGSDIQQNLKNNKLPHTTKLIEKLKEIVNENVDSDDSTSRDSIISGENAENKIEIDAKQLSDSDSKDKIELLESVSKSEVTTTSALFKSKNCQTVGNSKNKINLDNTKAANAGGLEKKQSVESQDCAEKITNMDPPKISTVSLQKQLGQQIDKNQSANNDIKTREKSFVSFRIHAPEKSNKFIPVRPSLENSNKSADSKQNEIDPPKAMNNDRDNDPKSKDQDKKVNQTSEIESEESRPSSPENSEHTETSDEASEMCIDKEKSIEIRQISLEDSPPSTSPSLSKASTVQNQDKKMIHPILDQTDPSLKVTLVTKSKDIVGKKIIKIVPVMYKSKSNEKENKNKSVDGELLKKTLESNKPSSGGEKPIDNVDSSVPSIRLEDVKTEVDSESESNGNQDNMEAKKKYLSALNILEKREATLKSKGSVEIRTRSKTEEKREKLRIMDNISKVIDDVAVNYSANHQETDDTPPPPKKKALLPISLTKSENNGEITVKSFAKLSALDTHKRTISNAPIFKQKARKSFPATGIKQSLQHALITERQQKAIAPATSASTPSRTEIKLKMVQKPNNVVIAPSTVTTAITTASTAITKVAIPALSQLEGMRSNGSYVILHPQQQDNLLLFPSNPTLNYTTSISNQVLSMTPCIVSGTSPHTAIRHISQPPALWNPNQSTVIKPSTISLNNTQGYIVQGDKEGQVPVSTSSTNNNDDGNGGKTDSNIPTTAKTAATTETSNSSLNPIIIDNDSSMDTEVSPASNNPETTSTDTDNNSVLLNNLVTQKVSKIVNDIIKRPPPKLKPRPPGVLSQEFSEGSPSSAGSVTAQINSISHRFSDYFRGMLIETLDDLGKSDNHEATITSLKMEIETLKHKHAIELSEIEQNMCTMLKDVQKSIINEREKIISETRATCELETLKRIEQVKSKQWCANCSKEAQFYCCWNTSYCDYPCQQKHWPKHMSQCTQNLNISSRNVAPPPPPTAVTVTATTSTVSRPSNGQQIILRSAAPSKTGSNAKLYSKALQKVYITNRGNSANASGTKGVKLQTSTGKFVTILPAKQADKTINSLNRADSNFKIQHMVSVTPSPSSSSLVNSSISSTTTKKLQSASNKKYLSPPTPVDNAMEEEDDESD